MIYNGTLISDNLYLRNLTPDDCTERYANWLNNNETNNYFETRFTLQTVELVREFVSVINNSPDSYLFGIFVDNMHIGNIKLGPIHKLYAYADISYFIGEKSLRGKGYAVRAINLVTQFGFGKLGLNRIQAGVHGSNINSQKVLERCGFTKEAVLRKKIYYGPDRIWDDHLYYGILKNEHLLPLTGC